MSLLLAKRLGRVLHLHMNTPENLNALSSEMLSTLKKHFAPENVKDVSVVLLSAAGKHFGAGHNLSEMASKEYKEQIFFDCSEVMKMVVRCPVPTVAAVQGCAFAAGCQLAASCDVVIAAPGAQFGTPGVKIGFFCGTPSVAVTRAANLKTAADMLFTGRDLTAEQALVAGLVSRIASSNETLLEEALAVCNTIAQTPREVVVHGKKLLLDQRDQPLDRAYDLASEHMIEGMRLFSAKEGIQAFLEKRPALWKAEEGELAQALALVKDGVAVVGASADASRASHRVFNWVKDGGYPTYPINPTASEVSGSPVYRTLDSVPTNFAVVDVFRKAGPPAAEVVDEAVRLAKAGKGIKAVWLQLGVRAPEAEQRARAAGLLVVADRCLAVDLREQGYLPPLPPGDPHAHGPTSKM